ncbi:MAG: hypothetical protein AB7K09_04440 [Planctomycetota bacterium]
MHSLAMLDAPLAGEPLPAWFARIADALLNGHRLRGGGDTQLRLLEVEAYLNAPSLDHADPFTHSDDMQLTSRRWYFHREGGSYRGGTFKGLDISFATAPGAYGGWLIRSLETADGNVVNGVGLCVDTLLAKTGFESVADLDAAIAGRAVDDASSPLHLEPRQSGERRDVIATARVGLTLKRAAQHPDMPRYLGRAYRFVTRGRELAKGRPQLVVALHEAGGGLASVIDGSGGAPDKVMEQIAAYDEGVATADLGPWMGRGIEPRDVPRVLGAWRGLHGR